MQNARADDTGVGTRPLRSSLVDHDTHVVAVLSPACQLPRMPANAFVDEHLAPAWHEIVLVPNQLDPFRLGRVTVLDWTAKGMSLVVELCVLEDLPLAQLLELPPSQSRAHTAGQ